MKLMWSIACEKVIVERESGQLSIIGILQNFTVRVTVSMDATKELEAYDVTLIPFRWHLVNSWTRSDPNVPEICKSRSRIYAPNNKAVAEWVTEIDLLGNIVNRRAFQKSEVFPFAGFGVYRIVTHGRSKGAKRWRKYSETSLSMAPGEAAVVEGESE